jgi:hypothetical protein
MFDEKTQGEKSWDNVPLMGNCYDSSTIVDHEMNKGKFYFKLGYCTGAEISATWQQCHHAQLTQLLLDNDLVFTQRLVVLFRENLDTPK